MEGRLQRPFYANNARYKQMPGKAGRKQEFPAPGAKPAGEDCRPAFYL
jgi:hypothetical protein